MSTRREHMTDDGWVKEPEDIGYWWFHGFPGEGTAEMLDVFCFGTDYHSCELVIVSENPNVKDWDTWTGRWKFQETPEADEILDVAGFTAKWGSCGAG